MWVDFVLSIDLVVLALKHTYDVLLLLPVLLSIHYHRARRKNMQICFLQPRQKLASRAGRFSGPCDRNRLAGSHVPVPRPRFLSIRLLLYSSDNLLPSAFGASPQDWTRGVGAAGAVLAAVSCGWNSPVHNHATRTELTSCVQQRLARASESDTHIRWLRITRQRGLRELERGP